MVGCWSYREDDGGGGRMVPYLSHSLEAMLDYMSRYNNR